MLRHYPLELLEVHWSYPWIRAYQVPIAGTVKEIPSRVARDAH